MNKYCLFQFTLRAFLFGYLCNFFEIRRFPNNLTRFTFSLGQSQGGRSSREWVRSTRDNLINNYFAKWSDSVEIEMTQYWKDPSTTWHKKSDEFILIEMTSGNRHLVSSRSLIHHFNINGYLNCMSILCQDAKRMKDFISSSFQWIVFSAYWE